ncbi:acyltransferase family protein [Microcella daejeonensis]|uniref:Acyltransferase family protein n=1 Tax=Microcella daejeonensis TaxID=2994971 RepID=A0A9E8MKU2_9MICO|nr:acyltransferase family protein [Microcella daejeonensis]WAB80912.1 acyltransferase family protein [Microcella daejeonensis]
MQASERTKAPRERVPFWDNARFVCITLVVAGHAIQRLTAESDNALVVYLFIYAFHMPAFAMISGYFSKPGAPGARQMRKVITDIVLPYVIMETIWTLVQFLVEGSVALNPTQPSWTLWFLLALGIFRLILPYLALLKWPLLWAVVFSVGVGYLSNVDSTFSLSRAIGILPFFVLGWKLKEWGLIERWRFVEAPARLVRIGSVAVLLVWVAVLVAFIDVWRATDLRFWFFYDDSYQGLGEDQWWAGLVRLLLIALAVLLSGCVFALVPRRETWMTAFGQATMYVYLLHSFVLYPIRESGVIGGDNSSLTWLIGLLLASVAITVALASPLVRRITRPIIEPKPRWIFREQPDEESREPRSGSSRVDPTGARRR